jgi:hypothetical protein
VGAVSGGAADRQPAEPCAAGDHGHPGAPATVGNDADGSLADPGGGRRDEDLGTADVEGIRGTARSALSSWATRRP